MKSGRLYGSRELPGFEFAYGPVAVNRVASAADRDIVRGLGRQIGIDVESVWVGHGVCVCVNVYSRSCRREGKGDDDEVTGNFGGIFGLSAKNGCGAYWT
jgi:hypothetical protein